MALSKKQIDDVEKVLENSIRNKFQNYRPEPASMPFHTRLLGKDRLALYSFIHSLNTNFGTSIFEPVALEIAKENFKSAKAQNSAGDKISSDAQIVIQKIIDGLTTANTEPNKNQEIEAIRKVCQSGEMINAKPTKVDLFLESKDGKFYLFDIKTAKPNAGGFKEFKRTLLEWVAVILAEDPKRQINSSIAIPYNPYEPQPYNRWTMRGMLDLEEELKVANEFWDFLGGKETYNDLLGCFERVGIKLRDEIDLFFRKFGQKK
ncbi:MAG: TdeIII family type II restriction endonuclease [Candidatus Berkelbacteria bacterium]|nr:TdeIII family type II restriction endonuclease [Candidatus Berkelbacteria bacterium]